MNGSLVGPERTLSPGEEKMNDISLCSNPVGIGDVYSCDGCLRNPENTPPDEFQSWTEPHLRDTSSGYGPSCLLYKPMPDFDWYDNFIKKRERNNEELQTN